MIEEDNLSKLCPSATMDEGLITSCTVLICHDGNRRKARLGATEDLPSWTGRLYLVIFSFPFCE